MNNCIIDDNDLPMLGGHKMVIIKSRGRLTCGVRHNGKLVKVHRLLTGASKDDVVDHINGNALDNRRANLRVCSAEQNNMNRKRYRNNTSGYKGVRWHKKDKRWVATIGVSGERIWLGSYKQLEEARTAYESASTKYFGEFNRQH